MPNASLLGDATLKTFAERAPAYDASNRFFAEDFEDLKKARYLVAPIPKELGGLGYDLEQMSLEQRRLDDYVRFRPGYPPALLELLKIACGLGPERVVADVGSGTGILTRLLLDSGARVIGVEPNAAMRAAAERALVGSERFESIDASADRRLVRATGAGTHSMKVQRWQGSSPPDAMALRAVLEG